MRLEILPGVQIEDPSREQIVSALEKAYAGSVDAVILSSDPQGYRFIQMAGGTQHIEYRDGEKSPVFAADGITPAQCEQIFGDFAAGGSRWKEGEYWALLIPAGKKGRLKRPKTEAAKEGSPDGPESKYIPLYGKPPTNKKTDLRKVLATIVSGIILGGGVCWMMVYLYGRLEPAQFYRLFAEMAFALMWFSCGGIAWAMLHHESTGVAWNIVMLFILFVFMVFFLLGAASLSVMQMGWLSFAFFSAVLAGGYTVYLAVRLLVIAAEFERDAAGVPGDHLKIKRLSESDLDGNSYEVDVLEFVYLEKYLDRMAINKRQKQGYVQALSEKRLQVQVRYLPRNPELHRKRIEVLDGQAGRV